MCGRYFVAPDLAERAALRAFFEQVRRRTAAAEQLQVRFGGEVRPGDVAVAVANDRSLRPSGFPMLWGMPRRQGANGLVINARCETAEARPLFAAATARHRCLLPASWYFEWAHDDARTRWAFGHEDGSPCYLAGLYALPERGTTTGDASRISRFVVLTRDATPALASIHGRMPVMVPERRAQDWLDLGRPFRDALTLATADVVPLAGK